MGRDRANALFLAGVMLALGALLGAPARAEMRAASMAIDANTGAVLHEQFADAPRYPASLTKIMTIFIAFREIEKGRLSFSSKIKISKRAASVAPSKLDLDPGEEIEVADAIKALVTKSANDVAVALAEHIGGSEAGFARMMNETAAEIGMRGTTFHNASGLPDKRQITTARDMLTLALRLQDEFPQHYRLFRLKSFEFRGKTYRTHNTLMHSFPGMDGIKTGYTRASGFNVVSSVRSDNKHVVAVVFGGATAAARNAHMRMLLYRTLQKASRERTRKPNTGLVARRRVRQQEQVATGLSAMPGEPQSQHEPEAVANVEPTPAAKWQTETRDVSRTPVANEARAAAPPKLKAEPKPQRAKKDPIAAVIARTNTVPTTRTVTTTLIRLAPATDDTLPQPSAPPQQHEEIAPPKLDLTALREAMASSEQQPPMTASVRPLARSPSTLDAQAQALAGNDGAPQRARGTIFARAEASPSRLQGPAAAAPQGLAAAPQGKGFEIQVGAYGTVEEARARIAAARKKAPGLLDNHDHVTMAVQREKRKIYRARFINFSEEQASSACLELRRLAIDCFVMKSAPQ